MGVTEHQRLIYPGLEPFGKDADLAYCGRSDQVAEACAVLRRTHFLAVTGAPRVGKTSFVQAGLIPALRGEGDWRVVGVTADGDPLRALAEALAAQGVDIPATPRSGEVATEAAVADAARRIEDFLLGGDGRLRRLLAPWEAAQGAESAAAADWLIFVDRFETLVRAASAHGARFVELLLDACMAPGARVHVAVALREDATGECAGFTGLAAAVSHGYFPLQRLRAEQLLEAIVEPARRAGFEVDTAAARRLADAVAQDELQLPLLQLRLADHSVLADLLRQSRVTDSAVSALGGAVGSLRRALEEAGAARATEPADDHPGHAPDPALLAEHAEQVFDSLDARQRRIAERMFRALAKPAGEDDGPAASHPLATLARWLGRSEASLREVARRFAAAPQPVVYLVPWPRPALALAHPRLAEHWPRLHLWSDDEAVRGQAFVALCDRARELATRPVGERCFNTDELAVADRLWAPNEARLPDSAWALRYRPQEGRAALRALRQLRRESRAALQAAVPAAAPPSAQEVPITAADAQIAAVETPIVETPISSVEVPISPVEAHRERAEREARLRQEALAQEEERLRRHARLREEARLRQRDLEAARDRERQAALARLTSGVSDPATLARGLAAAVVWSVVVLAAVALVAVTWTGGEGALAPLDDAVGRMDEVYVRARLAFQPAIDSFREMVGRLAGGA